MKLTQKAISTLIVVLLIASTCISLNGCVGSDKNDFPVKVANITVNSEPKNVVALSDNVADILSNIGYDTKLVGKSDECTQERLSVVPSVGPKSTPDVAKITAAKADLVFADNTLDSNYEIQLKDAGITIVKIMPADTKDELETTYKSIGTLLGGQNTGKEKANKAFKDLFETMQSVSDEKSSEEFKTICYLFLNDSVLSTFSKGSYGDTILGLTGATNVGPGSTVATINGYATDDGAIDANTLKRSNPSYIFYSDDDVKTYLEKNDVLKKLDAVTKGNMVKMPMSYFTRQGDSALDGVSFMCNKLFPNSSSSSNTSASSGATQVEDISTVADKYGITITDDMKFNLDDENENVLALQKRLDELGYMSVEPTGYFGELTVTAIKEFQNVNNMEQTGVANADVIKAIFSTDAVKNTTAAR